MCLHTCLPTSHCKNLEDFHSVVNKDATMIFNFQVKKNHFCKKLPFLLLFITKKKKTMLM